MTPGDPVFFFLHSSSARFLRRGDPFCYFFGGTSFCPLYMPALLLYCCSTVAVAVLPLSFTHCGFMGCWCMFFFCCVLCCTTTVPDTTYCCSRYYVLLYYRVAGWIGSRVCTRVPVFFFFALTLYRPRAGIVQRTTSNRLLLL